MNALEKIERPKPVSELVQNRLRAEIVAGEFALGAKISEAHLAERYGVTKAPIRAAFIRLEAEGLLEIRPQVGTFVFSPSAGEVRALCELRTALELEALTLAMSRNATDLLQQTQRICEAMQRALKRDEHAAYQELDTQLHLAIIECAGSPILHDTYGSQISGRFAALRVRFSKCDDHVAASSAEHYQLCDAIAQGKLPQAQAMLREHIDNTRAYFARLIMDLAA